MLEITRTFPLVSFPHITMYAKFFPCMCSYMIVNGATKHGDMKHFNEQLKSFKGDVCFEYYHEQQLLALQVS